MKRLPIPQPGRGGSVRCYAMNASDFMYDVKKVSEKGY